MAVVTAGHEELFYIRIIIFLGPQQFPPQSRPQAAQRVNKLGFNMEDLHAKEHDSWLGNGGFGRLSPCYFDSSASQELPVWGYSLRYRYGIFQQLVSPDGQQLEAPDPWLENSNPWELSRVDVSYRCGFMALQNAPTMEAAMPFERAVKRFLPSPIPGCNTRNTNNLRLWESKPLI